MKRALSLLISLCCLMGLAGNAGGETAMNLYERYLSEGTAPSLRETWAELFPVGTCLSLSQLSDGRAMDLVRTHFSSVTCENEMKADAVMDQAATLAAGDPERISLSFSRAVPILDFARDNGLRVRAHTLIWHSQTPRWAFTVDYSADGELAGRELMLRRMENYIADYLDFCNREYPGLVYAVDVVNEAVDPGSGHEKGLRTTGLWYQTVGEDYIQQAFAFARAHAAEGQQLYYNDYGCYDVNKQVYLQALLRQLRDQGLVDGLGMQTHIDMETPAALDYEKAMTAYLKLGLTVSVTEMDVKTTDASLAGQMRLAARYKAFFGMWRRMKAMAGRDIGGVTLWGFTDRHTWLSTASTPCYPLLFDAEYACKPAFFGALMDASIPISTSDEAIDALGLENSDHFVPENPELEQVFDEAEGVPEGVYAYPDSGAKWYQQLLEDSHLALGANRRLKRVIEKARAGEEVTIAVIGGSITEGAGAAKYSECWASRLLQGFRAYCGAGDGSGIRLVNAGVGGTPSTFGLMRYQRDVVDRVEDADGLPDLVVIEFSVNDWGEPTGHRCFESLVKTAYDAPNEPAVILLFAVFRTGFTLQDEMRRVGGAYDLMMVSLRDSAFPHVGQEWPVDSFFFDEYHPTSMGHAVMADCILSAVIASAEAEERPEPAAVTPAFGADFAGLISLFGDSDGSAYALDRGGFAGDDRGSYANYPVGRVCGRNFHHGKTDGSAPLRFAARMKNLLIAYRATGDREFGNAEVLVDGQVRAVLKGNTGSWGQSVVDLILDEAGAAEHTVEIRMAEGSGDKKFTVTAIGFSE